MISARNWLGLTLLALCLQAQPALAQMGFSDEQGQPSDIVPQPQPKPASSFQGDSQGPPPAPVQAWEDARPQPARQQVAPQNTQAAPKADPRFANWAWTPMFPDRVHFDTNPDGTPFGSNNPPPPLPGLSRDQEKAFFDTPQQQAPKIIGQPTVDMSKYTRRKHNESPTWAKQRPDYMPTYQDNRLYEGDRDPYGFSNQK